MLILKKRELELLKVTALENDTKILRELLKTKNEIIELKQNQIYDLKRENRILTAKLDNMNERSQGAVILYG